MASFQRPAASRVFHCQPLGEAASTTTGRRRCIWRPRRGTSTPSKARCLLLTAYCLLFTTRYSLLTTRDLLPTTHYPLLDSVKGLTRGECPELTVLDKFRMTPASSVKGRPPLHGQPAPRSSYGRPAPPLLYDTAPYSLPGPSIWRARAGTPRPCSTWCPTARSTGTCAEARPHQHRRRSWRQAAV